MDDISRALLLREREDNDSDAVPHQPYSRTLIAKEFQFKTIWQRSLLRSMIFTGNIEELV